MKRLTVILSYILVAVIGIFDYKTGYNISFALFYLAPVSLATWYGGLSTGVIIAVFSGVIWLGADLLAGHQYSYFVTPFWNMLGRIIFFLSPVFFIELRKMLLSEEEESRRDYLTRVLNRKGFTQSMSIELERSLRHNHEFTVVLIDCDNFKYINDQYGHDAGDSVLRLVADTLKLATRSADIIARIGGDEFVVCLPETGFEQSEKMIVRLRGKLAKVMKERNWPISFSMGAVTYKKPPPSYEDLLKKCDLLLYSVKRKGKNALEHEVFQ
jgi:diguanylate cyclase (GGDEF)-like protein